MGKDRRLCPRSLVEVVGDAQSTGEWTSIFLHIQKRDTDSGKLTEVDNGLTDM